MLRQFLYLGGWVGNAFPRMSSLFLVLLGAEVGSDARYWPSRVSWVEAGLADSRYRRSLLDGDLVQEFLAQVEGGVVDEQHEKSHHYWFHIGEILAIRQLLGHPHRPEFVGDLETRAPYRAT